MSAQLVPLALLGLCVQAALGQLSNAIAKDADLDPNSFRDSSPLAIEEVAAGCCDCLLRRTAPGDFRRA